MLILSARQNRTRRRKRAMQKERYCGKGLFLPQVLLRCTKKAAEKTSADAEIRPRGFLAVIVKRPSFYDEFRCIGSECKDNCCIGWEIDIDGSTLEKYNNIGGRLGEKLQRNIDCDAFPHFKLTENERCPFLNAQNLCEIILETGEENICEICREHPRFHSWYGGYKESGLGLCCEEAVRLLLNTDLEFENNETDEEDDDYPFDGEVFKAVFAFREKLFELFREKGSVFEKLRKMLLMCKTDYIPSLEEIISDALSAEPIDGEWTEKIKKIREREEFIRSELLSADENERYSKIAVYLIYRHFLKSGVYENDIIEKANFVYAFITLLRCFDILYPNSEIENIKLLSKQFEYLE